MVTRKTVKSAVRVPEKRDDETSTEKFLRECAERAALPEVKKVRKPKKSKPETRSTHLFPNCIFSNTSKREVEKRFKAANPWLFRPEEIRKQVQKQVREGHSLAFAKQLGLVLSLSFKVSDHFEQLDAINPGLFKAQEDGTIELGIWETISELNEAWKKLITMP
jgi:hypothetical protein